MAVRFTVPKGSLEKATFTLLEKAWYGLSKSERTYRPKINDPEIQLKVLRPQEIPIYVSEGMHDIGITGKDWIKESGADVNTILDLEYGHIKIVVAAPKKFGASSISDIFQSIWDEGKTVRISTEYLNIASDYVKSIKAYSDKFGNADPLIITPWWKKGSNPKVSIFLSFGATEAKPPEESDLIIDVTETGRSLQQNNLNIIDVVMESSAVLVVNKKSYSDPSKKEKLLDILTLLKGVIDAEKKLHIFANVKEENLNELLSSLPALKRPTVSPLSDKGWYSINTVINRNEFVTILPILRKLAQGLVVHYPAQILPLEEIVNNEQ